MFKRVCFMGFFCATMIGCTPADKSEYVEEEVVCEGTNDPQEPVSTIVTAPYHLSGHASRTDDGRLKVVLNPIVETSSGDRVENITNDDVTLLVDGEAVAVADVQAIDASAPEVVDVVFVLDTTGSMFWAIDGVKTGLSAFVTGLELSGADVQVGGAAFGDSVRQVLSPSSPADFESWMQKLAADGGGDAAENPLDAINYAHDTFTFRDKAQRFYIVITDQGFQESGVGCSNTTLAEVAEKTRGEVLYGLVHAELSEPAGVHPKRLIEAAGGLYLRLNGNDILDFDIAADTSLDELIGDTHIVYANAADVPEEASSVDVTVDIDGVEATLSLTIN